MGHSPATRTGSPIEVLLIEENPTDAFAVRRSFGTITCPVHVESISRLDSALTVLRMRRFDVVVMDLGTNLDMLEKFLTRGPEMPVIAIGDGSSEGWHQAVLSVGANAYVPKDAISPLLGMTLLSTVQTSRTPKVATA